MGEKKQSSISKTDTLEKMGEFWDTHDFRVYFKTLPPVTLEHDKRHKTQISTTFQLRITA